VFDRVPLVAGAPSFSGAPARDERDRDQRDKRDGDAEGGRLVGWGFASVHRTNVDHL